MRTGSLLLRAQPSGPDPAGSGPAFFFASSVDGAFVSNPALVPIPAGLLAGDFVFLHVSCGGGVPTTAAGFTRVAAPAGGASYYYYKFADATDQTNAGTGSWSVPYAGDSYVISRAVYRGVNAGTPFAAGPTEITGSSTTVNGPAMTGPGLYVQTLVIDGNTTLTSNPAGMSMRTTRNAWGWGQHVSDAPLGVAVGSNFPATQGLGFTWSAFAMLLQ